MNADNDVLKTPPTMKRVIHLRKVSTLKIQGKWAVSIPYSEFVVTVFLASINLML